jgi:hypothetical protein
MNYVLATEPYADTSPLLNELAGIADRLTVSMGWNSENISSILPAWRAGKAVIVTDRLNGVLTGAAGILRTPSAIHEADALVIFAVPAPDREAPLINYCKMVAKAHGARGISLSLDVQAPLKFLDLLGQQGFTAKAMVYGSKL